MKNQSSENGNPEGLLYAGILLLLAAFANKYSTALTNLYWTHWLKLTLLIVLLGMGALFIVGVFLWNKYCDYCYEQAITAPDSSSASLGSDEVGKEVSLKQAFRTSHTQVIGTTSAGKTKSVILPLIINDIQNGSGMLIIDGKSDVSFLEELYSNVVAAGRQSDFRLFSLANIGPSCTFNPLAGGTPHEVVERVFSSFPFDNEYYRNVQYKIFLSLVSLIDYHKETPTVRLVHTLLTYPNTLKQWTQICHDEDLKRNLTAYLEEPSQARMEKVSGLDAYLSHFITGNLSLLFNAKTSAIQLEQALKEGHICYFQLPTMYYPFLAEATGKLVLQCFQSAVAKRHLGSEREPKFFSCFLDDFQDYIYPGFAALLNKSRSANIGVVFSHQALGDLEKVSPSFRNIVLTNTNIKIVMRSADPETCEYFAKSFGTKGTEKVTERRTMSQLGEIKTGEGSVREVEEFIYHPNVIRQLRTGEGIVTIPHPKGVKYLRVRFKMKPPLPPVPLPEIKKELIPIPIINCQENAKPTAKIT